MKIRRVTLDGVAGVPDGAYSLVDPALASAAPIVAVTGPPSSGKTRFLQAITTAKEDVGPYGFRPRGQDLIRPGADTAKITVEWQLDQDERDASGATQDRVESESLFGARPLGFPDHDDALAMILARYEHLPNAGKVDYFPATRAFPRGSYAAMGRPIDETAMKRLRLDPGPDKYAAIRQYLIELSVGLQEHSTDPARLGPKLFADAFSSLCRTKRFEGINRGKVGIRVLFSRPDGTTFDLDLLSDSERNAVLFAATFVQLQLSRSIILIDTPELFVAEDDVVRFVSALHAMGTDNQLVVATSSPALLRSLPPAAIVRLTGVETERRLA